MGGTGWPVQVQPVENGVSVVVDGGGGGGGGGGWAEEAASHSDSAWRDMASRRCLRMCAAAARADEGKAVEEEEDEDESEEKELEDMLERWGLDWS
jgi:hypothetical protein